MKKITSSKQLKQHGTYYLTGETDGQQWGQSFHFLENKSAISYLPDDWVPTEEPSASFIPWFAEPITARTREELFKICQNDGIKIYEVNEHEKDR